MVRFLDTWWTVAPAWIEVIALIGILLADLFLARLPFENEKRHEKNVVKLLADVNRLHSGNVQLVWDDEGNAIKVPKD